MPRALWNVVASLFEPRRVRGLRKVLARANGASYVLTFEALYPMAKVRAESTIIKFVDHCEVRASSVRCGHVEWSQSKGLPDGYTQVIIELLRPFGWPKVHGYRANGRDGGVFLLRYVDMTDHHLAVIENPWNSDAYRTLAKELLAAFGLECLNGTPDEDWPSPQTRRRGRQ